MTSCGQYQDPCRLDGTTLRPRMPRNVAKSRSPGAGGDAQLRQRGRKADCPWSAVPVAGHLGIGIKTVWPCPGQLILCITVLLDACGSSSKDYASPYGRLPGVRFAEASAATCRYGDPGRLTL